MRKALTLPFLPRQIKTAHYVWQGVNFSLEFYGACIKYRPQTLAGCGLHVKIKNPYIPC